MNNTANFYNTYVTAIALKSIAWKYYLVFVALNLTYGTSCASQTSQTSLSSLLARFVNSFYLFVIGIIWYFIGVETKGRTLEELKEVFEAPWPPKAALKKEKMVRKGDGRLDRVV